MSCILDKLFNILKLLTYQRHLPNNIMVLTFSKKCFISFLILATDLYQVWFTSHVSYFLHIFHLLKARGEDHYFVKQLTDVFEH